MLAKGKHSPPIFFFFKTKPLPPYKKPKPNPTNASKRQAQPPFGCQNEIWDHIATSPVRQLLN